MKLLLILGIPLAVAVVIIVIIIIANCIPSFDERRRGETSQTPGTSKTKRRFGPGLVIILLVLTVVVGVVVIKRFSPAAYPIAADAQDLWPSIGETVKVKICLDRWSGWINLPPSTKFSIDAPGEIEYFFWSGERTLIKDKNTKWLGEIPHCSFRIRGTAGEATITIQ